MTQVYTGPYDGLTAEELAYLAASGPFRLETTLYVDISDAKMGGYTMALLWRPRS